MVAAAEKQGASQSELMGTVQNDLLKEYIARNTYIFGPEPSMRLITEDSADILPTNLLIPYGTK